MLPVVEKVDIEHLPLLDLNGNMIEIGECFQKYLLLIFLRHLA